MKETCPIVDELKETLKQFMGVQFEINDLISEDTEKLEKKITELDNDTTIVLKDLIRRVIILEAKVKLYESQNVREDINKINDKMIRINKKHTTEINDVQHRLNIIERERRRNNESFEKVFDEIHKIYEYMERLENRINGIAEFAHSTDRVVRAICADLDNKGRKEKKNNASNK